MDRTMDLNTRRVILAREILSTDSEVLLSELEKTYKRVSAKLPHIVILNTPAEPEPDSKEYILSSIKEGYKEMQEIKAGKKKGIPARELLKELQDEAV